MVMEAFLAQLPDAVHWAFCMRSRSGCSAHSEAAICTTTTRYETSGRSVGLDAAPCSIYCRLAPARSSPCSPHDRPDHDATGPGDPSTEAAARSGGAW